MHTIKNLKWGLEWKCVEYLSVSNEEKLIFRVVDTG